jgi:hypothetical protein
VADVRCLVRVDGSVLDDGFAFAGRRRRERVFGKPRAKKGGPIQEAVQIAVWRGLDARQAVDLSDRGSQFLRDRPRRLAQPPRELERDRQRQVTERAVWRVVDDDRRHVGGRQAELSREHGLEACAEDVVDGENHRVMV